MRERRHWSKSHEYRTEGRKLLGYAALFNVTTQIGNLTESIRSGAFTNSLNENDILALFDHDPAMLLGRTSSGTLRLAEDLRGLRFEIDIPDTQVGHDVLALAQRGDLGGMSFGFTVAPSGEQRNGNFRELTAINLHEISVVSAWPAYNGTSVEARSLTPQLNRLSRYLAINMELLF